MSNVTLKQPRRLRRSRWCDPVSRSAVFLMTSLVHVLCACSVAQEPDSLKPDRHGRLTSRVSPALEIEILDPNQDARSNPSINMTTDANGGLQVEIPPALIVHRYYYTGDRSFRGPNFPGGPSIVVVKDPRDGKQLYLPVEMLPGSPIVSYSSKSIEYDFGGRAVIIRFPFCGDPTVSYRSGRSIQQKAASAFELTKIPQVLEKAKESAKTTGDNLGVAAKATGLLADGLAKPFMLPAQNLSRLIPGQAALSDPTLKARITEKSAIEAQNASVARAAEQSQLQDLDIQTRP